MMEAAILFPEIISYSSQPIDRKPIKTSRSRRRRLNKKHKARLQAALKSNEGVAMQRKPPDVQISDLPRFDGKTAMKRRMLSSDEQIDLPHLGDDEAVPCSSFDKLSALVDDKAGVFPNTDLSYMAVSPTAKGYEDVKISEALRQRVVPGLDVTVDAQCSTLCKSVTVSEQMMVEVKGYPRGSYSLRPRRKRDFSGSCSH